MIWALLALSLYAAFAVALLVAELLREPCPRCGQRMTEGWGDGRWYCIVCARNFEVKR